MVVMRSIEEGDLDDGERVCVLIPECGLTPLAGV